MNPIQTITKTELRNNRPIRITDGDWLYNIMDGEDGRTSICVAYNGNRDIKRVPTE